MEWFSLYQPERTNCVVLNDFRIVSHGVTQGLIFVPLQFSLYFMGFTNIPRKHKIDSCCYTDDTPTHTG